MSELWMPPGAIVEQGGGSTPEGIQDKLIGETIVGGPQSANDARMMLDVQTLEKLLRIAKSSLSGRVVLNQVGFKVRVWRGGDGNTYQILSILSHPPKPESTPFDVRKG